MRNTVFIFSLLVFSIVLNSCFSDLGCLFEFPENKNELRLMEVMYRDSLSDVQVLRKSVFIGEGTDIPNEHEFTRLYYSFDGMTSYFWNGKKGFMNYGADKKVFEQPLLINHPSFLEYNSSPNRSQFDYQLSSNTSIYHEYELYNAENPFTGDSIYITKNFLYQFDHSLNNSEQLMSFEPVFLDSSTFTNTRFFDQRYTPDNEILFVAGEITSSILFSEEDDYYYDLVESSQSFVLRLKGNSTFDTLLVFPRMEEVISYPRPYVSANRILFSYGGFTYEFNRSNQELRFLYEGDAPDNMAVDDQSLIFDKGTKHYSFADNKVTDLSDYFEDIIFSIPYKNLVAVQTRSEKDKIFVIDLNIKSITNTITNNELPEFSPVAGNSSYRLENPIFTKDGELMFMYIRQTYLTDVEFEKRCG